MNKAQQQAKIENTLNSISIREIRVSKSLVSPISGNSHSVELVAEIEERDIPSAVIATHILALKAEEIAMLHLFQSDGVPESERLERVKTLRSSYSILIASEMENI